jgi:hypothetical protein
MELTSRSQTRRVRRAADGTARFAMITFMAATIGVALMVAEATAQSAGPGLGQKQPVARSFRPTSVLVSVRDRQGANLSNVRLLVSGAEDLELVTGAAGTALITHLKNGNYRVRCEREGFITLERDLTVRSDGRKIVEIVLDAVPPPPLAVPHPPSPPIAEMVPSGTPVTMSILDFLDRNFIGREPLKESILACEPLETVRLLQIREGLARHVHDRVDEIIYVLAGEGSVNVDEEVHSLRPGSLAIMPHGTAHAVNHAGKNPLVVVSALVGSPCESAKLMTTKP